VTGTSGGVGQGSTVRPVTDDCQGESRHD
jgi:hypothetical protein